MSDIIRSESQHESASSIMHRIVTPEGRGSAQNMPAAWRHKLSFSADLSCWMGPLTADIGRREIVFAAVS